MKVELFEVEEINASEASAMAADSSAIELIEKLGLTGQKTLVQSDTATRQTFKRMTLVEDLVFTILFPERVLVQNFATEVIPLRVLEALQKAKESGKFVRFEVWHSRTRKDDPLLVAFTGELSPQSWDQNFIHESGRFLIARWDEALAPFWELATEAKSSWMATRKALAKRQVIKAETALKMLEEDAEIAFRTGQLPESLP